MSYNSLFSVGNILKSGNSDGELRVLVTEDVSGYNFSGVVVSDTRREVIHTYEVGHFSNSWVAHDYLWELVSSNHNEKDNLDALANKLELYNRWWRGETLEQPDNIDLGVLIDEVIKELRK